MRVLADGSDLRDVVLQLPQHAFVQRVLGHGAADACALHQHPHRAAKRVPALEHDVATVLLHNGAHLLGVRGRQQTRATCV